MIITRKEYELIGGYTYNRTLLWEEYKRRQNVIRNAKIDFGLNSEERLYISVLSEAIGKYILKEYFIVDEAFLPEIIHDIKLKTLISDFINNINAYEDFDDDEKELIKKIFYKYSAMIYVGVSKFILSKLYSNLPSVI